jgi:F-type H+-transporting ATPase subunit b
MDSLIETFHIDWKLMIAQAINFAVVLLVLWRFALRPLKKLMDERSKTIEGGLMNAEKQKDLLKAQQEQYDATLAKARAEASELMKEVKKDAEAKRQELLAKAQEESLAVLASGKAQLEADKAKMLTEAKTELVAMITTATEKVLGETVTAKVESKLVEDSIKNI